MSQIEPDLWADVDDSEELVQAEVEVVEDELLADDEEYEADADLRRRFIFFQAAPAWLVSTLIHVLILLVLGLLTIANPIQIVNVLTASATKNNGPEIEEFAISESEPNEMEEIPEEMTEPVEITEPIDMVEPTAMEVPMDDIAVVPLEMSDFATVAAPQLLNSSRSLPPFKSQWVAEAMK